MTAVVEQNQEPVTAAVAAKGAVASWRARVGAFAIDVLAGLGAIAALVPGALAAQQGDWSWWVYVVGMAAVVLAVAVNRLLLPPTIGWSAGRAVFGIAVVRHDGAAVGPWRLLLRDLTHLLDSAAALIGWFWPLWDRRGRTFADLLVRTEVHRRAPTPQRAGHVAALLVSVLALVAIGAAVLGYAAVYRPELAVAQAREQLAVQGPKIVEETLSYTPETLQADFARAQSLVTDGYRPQLVAQQQAVQKSVPVANEYWVSNSAVLDSTDRTASMLMLMQGQRGAGANMRTITATVTVNFVRSDDGRWQIAGLTVLAKPAPGAGGR